MTLEKLFDTFDIDEVEAEQFKQFLRNELAKMVAEVDTRHLVFTSFDKALDTGVKNAVIRHIFKEWEL